MTKHALREWARIQRDKMSRKQIIEYGSAIRYRLCHHTWFISSRSIFIYVSTQNEVPTYEIIERALKEGKTVSVPRVSGKGEMQAVPIQNITKDLIPGKYNIPEPRPSFCGFTEKEIDLVLVPGLLFDRNGYRIGYGGGYYDRYLARVPASCKTIGLAYHRQILGRIPHDAQDKKVKLVITERENIGG